MEKNENILSTENCPIRNILNRIGDKWSMLVIITLHENELMRFNELHRAIGDISHRMLTVTLRSLESDGLVCRKVYAEVPPKVEYNLTDMGCSLIPHLQSLLDWAIDNTTDIELARRNFNV